MPDVTVLMPVWNGERFLQPAINSVLAQTYRDFELLIVDDGSTDGTAAILDSYRDPRVKVVRNERNSGLSASLNRGLSLTCGNLIARQDADDVSEPERLQKQVGVMRARAEVALVGSQATAINENGRYVGRIDRSVEHASIQWFALVDNPFIHSSVMFRRSVVWDELGGFDASFDPFSQDWAMWSQVAARHGVMSLDDRLVRYRVRGASIMGGLETAAAGPEYRRRFERVVREIVARNARAMFGDVVTPAEIALLSGFALGVELGSVGAFLDVFSRLRGEFERRHPGATRSLDFQRTFARQVDALAYRVFPPTRRAGLQIYARALREQPAIARWLSWPRVVALAVLGKDVRRRLGRLRRRDVNFVSHAADHGR